MCGKRRRACRRFQGHLSVPSIFSAWVAGLAMLALVLFTPGVLNDGDSFSHVAAGNWMLAHHAVLRSDPFSFSRPGAPWVAHEWLAEILMAAIFRVSGWSGLVAMTAIAASATMFQLGRHLARWLPAAPTLIILLLAAACITPEMLARPHILALPVFEAWAAALFIARSEGRAPHWRLLPLMCLWANLHGGFIIGLVLLAALGLEAVVEQPARWRHAATGWGGFLAAALGASLLTPYGLDGLLQPFTLAAMPELSHVGEWQPTDFSTLQPLELLLIIGLYLGLGKGARLAPVRLLVVLGLLHMALQHTRHLLLIGIILPLLVAQPLGAVLSTPRIGRWRTGRLAFAIGAVACLLVAVRLLVPIRLGNDATAPVAALARVPQALRGEPVLNDYAFGGYLIFQGVRPFIDARAEMYGPAFLGQYAAIIRPDMGALKTVLQDYGIRWTILSPTNPAVQLMDVLPGWCRLYADSVAVVHVTECQHAARQ